MTAATVTTYYVEPLAEENVILTASDGETYICRRLKTPVFVQATSLSDVDAHLNATISGQTITINFASQTDKLVALNIKGFM